MNAEISMSHVMREVTLNVTVRGEKVAKARLWLGAKIMLLAAAVMGCGIEIEIEADR